MSLTLQDAQHVSWKIFVKTRALSESDVKKTHDPSALVADLLQEAGEVAAAVKSSESLKQQEPESKKMLGKKLDDLLYCVFVLAEHYGLNLEESFLEHVNDNLLRLLV